MYRVLRRFPDVAQDIFKQLDDKSLVNCMEVSKIWHNFLNNDSLFWRRRILKYDKCQTEFKEAWKLVTTQVPIGKLREVASTIEKFCKSEYNHTYLDFDGQFSPLNIGAAVGNISMYKYVVEKIGIVDPEDMNPSTTVSKKTPIHFAAENGHLEIVNYIAQYIKEVNPANKIGSTPLHYAAENGHMVVFKYIAEHLENKNPAANGGWTPLHYAANFGHMEIVKYIAEHLENNNPANYNGGTPLHNAAENGHLEIVKYIAEHLENKNPANNGGWTPLHNAAENGHMEIVKYLIGHLDAKNPANIDGWTPIYLARKRKHHKIVAYLKEAVYGIQGTYGNP